MKSEKFDPTFFEDEFSQSVKKINDRLAMEIRSFLESFPVRATEGEMLPYFGPAPIFIQDLDS